ncbi:type II toxin-antitoxin system mRNA interferase toxin, RelE/StbE family [Pseudomonas nitroreducens]|uniref:type II toxin-antitoxin system RelE/ParE family toxin n=1 Tax=Pseudomonas TaxID=286 RepID=UPI0007EE3B95|nr:MULTISPECIES: type II toxin-antitoxin system mRNA interferase toxin, RelE/StbE family [Pseudomonas]MDH1072392.1 type II toxin-antitoxin system mRNA interferase toxin, RelE/StbE family [Pseudomonas nitroreducens]NMZ71974.1 type II toxin-antitoxin system mRNA interferase toxin, RelE/StbE family [Pseudomonas nitroreducens]OBY57844.1 addiction module toxin RelE [Pseudomonas sp. AU12215]UCL86385.1 type II toxin-antitoxin system mRNA interferase toxin, RelE/StbE family [Pseudomonas sp. HS-18]
MKVFWTRDAQQDRLDIWEYLASENPGAAAHMDILFSTTAARLRSFPMMGKPGRIPGTRELIPHESYRLVYQIEADVLWVLALVHTSRMWPPLGDDQRHQQ